MRVSNLLCHEVCEKNSHVQIELYMSPSYRPEEGNLPHSLVEPVG